MPGKIAVLAFCISLLFIYQIAVPQTPPDSSLLILTDGLSQFGMKNGIVCTVADLNDSATAIIFGDEDTYSNEFPKRSYPAIVRATFHQNGRVVAMGQEGYACWGLAELDNSRFMLNAIKFLDSQNTRKVLIDKGHADWLDLSSGLPDSLRKYGYTVDTITSKINAASLQSYGVFIIGNAWNDFLPMEYTAVEEFVNNGKGLFLMGLGWSWVAYHPQSTLEDYPMNKFAIKFGLKFVNDTMQDPSDNIDGNISYIIFHNFYPLLPDIEEPPARPYRVLVDQSHDYTFLWDWKMGSSYLAQAGIKYSRNMATLDSTANPDLFKYDALMIPQVWSNAAFLPEEIAHIKKFVQDGGGLLLVGVANGKPDTTDFPMHCLAREFGVSFQTGGSVLNNFIVYEHEITTGVSAYQTEATSLGSIVVPGDWDTLLTDTREKLIGAAGSYGNGRVVVFADHNLINFSVTHNTLLVENIGRWLSANIAGRDSTFTLPERIYPEFTLTQDLITYQYAKNMEDRVLFLYDNYDTVTMYLKQQMSVNCIYDLNILALATGGGGYSSGSEIGIGLLTSNPAALAVYAHELTHSWQNPGGEVPWMGEGWAILSAERVCRKYGGEYLAWAQDEYQSWQSTFRQYDPLGKNIDLTEYGTERMSVPNGVYTGKFIWIIEDLESKYGADLMNRYFLLRRKYYDPSAHGAITTQKIIYFLSWAAGQELYTYFKSKRTLVEKIPVNPVVFSTYPEYDDSLKYTNAQIAITFNAKMTEATLNFQTIKVTGAVSGAKTGTALYVDSTRTVYLQPTLSFAPGEKVTVGVTNQVQDIWGNALDGDGDQTAEGADTYLFSFTAGTSTNVKTGHHSITPDDYQLSQNYPNPFNEATSFTFSLPEDTNVTLRINNVLGQQIALIGKDEKYQAGCHALTWNARDIPTGIYFLILETDHYKAKKKILYLK